LPPAARSKELTLSEIAGEAVCAGVSCAAAGSKVIADVTTSDIKIEGLVISAPTISMNSTERQRSAQPFNKLD
jgi:hypothetical protein